MCDKTGSDAFLRAALAVVSICPPLILCIHTYIVEFVGGHVIPCDATLLKFEIMPHA